ncbi:hypothetical protein CLUG_05650 [Clavispora lusitaniae ATCC 42720]|uniref:Uncharacterized protein n=1 Tax=Clavispora lusitaniae (strain ATCC 42720) TaxID=306902 RepID=C4YBS2_CLAL4|nr:uncharacterized protein CLUG_05650 [Clavispora lusitaniae ATCC 42720]EEQ41522.1 hypothetical protein CLUG_05650 [Clavispora lusitaniae ATCC 42720]
MCGATAARCLTTSCWVRWWAARAAFFASTAASAPMWKPSTRSACLTGNRRCRTRAPCAIFSGRTRRRCRRGRCRRAAPATCLARPRRRSSAAATTSRSLRGRTSLSWRATRRCSRARWSRCGRRPTTATAAATWRPFSPSTICWSGSTRCLRPCTRTRALCRRRSRPWTTLSSGLDYFI